MKRAPVIYSAVDESLTVRMALAPFDDRSINNDCRIIAKGWLHRRWAVSAFCRLEPWLTFAGEGEAIDWLLRGAP